MFFYDFIRLKEYFYDEDNMGEIFQMSLLSSVNPSGALKGVEK